MYSIIIQELNDQIDWIRLEMNEHEDFSKRWIELKTMKRNLKNTLEELEFMVDCQSRKLDKAI